MASVILLLPSSSVASLMALASDASQRLACSRWQADSRVVSVGVIFFLQCIYVDTARMQVSSARASGTDKAKSRLSAKMTPESARLPTKAQLPRRDPFVAVKFLRQKRRLDIPDRSGKRQSMSVLEAQFALRVR